MNRLNKLRVSDDHGLIKFSLPIPHCREIETLDQLKQYIKKNIKSSLSHKFNSPEELERFVKEKAKFDKRYESKTKWFKEELDILEDKLYKPNFHTEYLWEKLINLIVRMSDPHCYCYDRFKSRAYGLAKKIIEQADSSTT